MLSRLLAACPLASPYLSGAICSGARPRRMALSKELTAHRAYRAACSSVGVSLAGAACV